jgi:hypothetical protein
MLPFALLLIAAGAVSGYCAKILMLFPATVLAWAATALFCQFAGFSTGQTVFAAFFGGAWLQLGYLAGAVCLHRRTARARECAAIVARR